jgi:hypothetical protein
MNCYYLGYLIFNWRLTQSSASLQIVVPGLDPRRRLIRTDYRGSLNPLLAADAE